MLARRGKTLGRGLWSLPGGKLEAGETAQDAAHRELREETGITADLRHLVGQFEINTGAAIYDISCFTGFYLAGLARPASDTDALAWVRPNDLSSYSLAHNTADAIALARKLVSL